MCEGLELSLFGIGATCHRLQTRFFTQVQQKMKQGVNARFQVVDFLRKPAGLSQSIMRTGIWVIKDFSRGGILQIGIQSPPPQRGQGGCRFFFTYVVVLHTNLLYNRSAVRKRAVLRHSGRPVCLLEVQHRTAHCYSR